MTDLNDLREKVSKTFHLPDNGGEINWERVCLLSTTSQPVVMQADIQSVQPLFWGHCLWDCVCCQMLPCNWKETVWTLLPPAAAAGTSGMLALSGALLTRLFIHSTFFFPPHILSVWNSYFARLHPHVKKFYSHFFPGETTDNFRTSFCVKWSHRTVLFSG